MRTPPLLPLLRSQTQGKVLAHLYLNPTTEFSLTELAGLVHASVKTVQHEADRLTQAGLITSRKVGNLRLVAADTTHLLARPLTDLLVVTYGPVPVLTDLLAGVQGLEHVFIYGSWAARHAGKPGPVPADLDVLVVGDADLDELDDISRAARARLGFDVNVHRISGEAWTSSPADPFLIHVRSQSLVELGVSQGDA